MAYEGGPNYERAGQVFYYLFVAAMLFAFGYIALKPRTPDPSNSKAFGCYTAPGAPPILLNQQGMTIFQPTVMRIDYHLERHKTGIALTADAPIAAELVGDHYVYSIKPPGIGWYLDFFNVIGGHKYGVFDENQLRQFTMLARDGTYLPYRKSPSSACRR